MTINSYGSTRPTSAAPGGGTIVLSELINIPITSTTFSATVPKTAAAGPYTVYAQKTSGVGNATLSITDATSTTVGSLSIGSSPGVRNLDLESDLASITLDYVYPAWTTRSPGFGTTVVSAATYGKGLWLVGGPLGKLSTSTDLVTWTTRDSTFGASSITELVYGGGLFVAGGSGGQLRYSTDGITWTTSTSPFGASTISGLTYGEGKFVAAAGTAIATSTDAVTWTTQTSPFIANGKAISCVAYGNTLFMAGCPGLQGGTAVTMICFSTDAITWTSTKVSTAFPNPAGDGDYGVNSLVYSSNAGTSGIWVAVGDIGTLATLPHGSLSFNSTWVSRTSGFSTSNINDVTYGDGAFVAVGVSGKLSVSTNGTTWTAKTPNFGTTSINAVAYGNGIFTAVGGPDGVRTSESSSYTYVQIASI